MREQIEQVIGTIAENTPVPVEITERNINVSIYRQEDLLRHLEEKINRDGTSSVIPLHPLGGEEVYRNLLSVFGRISQRLERLPGQGYVYYARLALQWMRGQPLSRLIEDAYRHKQETKKTKREPSVATTIRSVMADVEQHLRFRYVKYTSCYNDLLRHALIQTGHADKVARLPNLPLYLELGASSATMVNLIGLGLTRTTAGVVASYAINKELSRPEADRWLRSQNWEGLGVSRICVREIEQVTGYV